jgi:hypothetical protein
VFSRYWSIGGGIECGDQNIIVSCPEAIQGAVREVSDLL